MNLLMQVVVVLFCIGQLFLELNLSSSQNIFCGPGFIPLVEHMDQHALSVPIGGGQTLDLLSQCTHISLIGPSPLGRLIALMSQLSHLYTEPLNFGVVIPLKLTSVITGMTKSTRHASQATFYSIESLYHCEHGAHG